jgi:hypothetical protein
VSQTTCSGAAAGHALSKNRNRFRNRPTTPWESCRGRPAVGDPTVGDPTVGDLPWETPPLGDLPWETPPWETPACEGECTQMS